MDVVIAQLTCFFNHFSIIYYDEYRDNTDLINFFPCIEIQTSLIILSQSISGQPLSGPDIGGFAGNATPRLFGRWMGVGAMFPFSRGHSEAGTVDHEPWSFGEEVRPYHPMLRCYSC